MGKICKLFCEIHPLTEETFLFRMVVVLGRYPTGNPLKKIFEKIHSFARKFFCPFVFTSAVRERERERERERQ